MATAGRAHHQEKEAGKIVPGAKTPINHALKSFYHPIIRLVLRARVLTILLALAGLVLTVWPARQLGSEFMPNLNEGTLL